MGGTVIVGPQPVTLFNGVTPKNGFMAQLMANNNGICNINDNGPPGINFLGSNAGFLVAGYRGIQSGPASGSLVPVAPPGIFVTPPGYKPMGPVSIACVSFEDPSFPIAVEVRGW